MLHLQMSYKFSRLFSRNSAMSPKYSILLTRTLLSESTTKIEQYKRQRIFLSDILQQDGVNNTFQVLSKVTTAEDARKNIKQLITAVVCAQNDDDCNTVKKNLNLLMSPKDSGDYKFAFGANVMRMYHYLDMPDEAFTAYNDQKLNSAFQDNTCHLLLMDLLYVHNEYSKVMEVYFAMKKFNIDSATLAFGALYHINTPESLSKSQSLLIHMSTKYAVTRRAVLFAAMLALNQNKPSHALESLKFCKPDTVARNIKLMSLCKLHRVKEVLSELHQIQLETGDISKLWALRIYRDCWNEILTVVDNHTNEEYKDEFEKLKTTLEQGGVLSHRHTDVFLDRILPADVDYKKERAKRILHRSRKQPT